MNRYSLIALIALTGSASAQGLLGVLPTIEDTEQKPVKYGVAINGGYDSNVNTVETNETGSAYTGGELTADFHYTTERTVFGIGLTGGATYYFDQVEGSEDTLYTGRVGGSLTHGISDRLSIDDSFYAGYEFDPNFVTGASTNRRSDQYFYGHNTLALNYLWTDRVTTSTTFLVSGTIYEEEEVASSEDRVEYGVSQLVRYALTEQTGLRADYRFRYTDYDTGRVSNSHVVTGGLDHQFNEHTMLVGAVGVEFYDQDEQEEQTKPFAELGLNRTLTDDLTIHWSNRLGHESVGTQIYGANYTYRTNLSMSYQHTEKLSSFAGATYFYSDYQSQDPSNTENMIEGRVGFNYELTPVFGLGLSYSYTDLSSDIPGDSYERQRVNLSLNATF